MTTVPMRQAGTLLAEVLAWCAENPWGGGDLTPGDLTLQQHYTAEDDTRTVSTLGAVPEVVAISVELLEKADPQLLKFDDCGLLTFDVQPERLLYEPLYVGWRAESVVFRRVCTRCHNSRIVPDWSRGLDRCTGSRRPRCARSAPIGNEG
jgi:hypothetical protein